MVNPQLRQAQFLALLGVLSLIQTSWMLHFHKCLYRQDRREKRSDLQVKWAESSCTAWRSRLQNNIICISISVLMSLQTNSITVIWVWSSVFSEDSGVGRSDRWCFWSPTLHHWRVNVDNCVGFRAVFAV